MSESERGARRLLFARGAALSAIAAVMLMPNRDTMGQTGGAEPELEPSQVRIEATVSSSGAIVTIASEKPEDPASRGALAAYGKLLAERVPRGDTGLLLSLIPASAEMAKRLKAEAVTYTVAMDGPTIRLELIASDQQSRTAIHEYVQPVVQTRRQRSTNHPGNNLGWDAPVDPDVKK